MTVKSLARGVVGAVASSRVAVAVAWRSRRRCLRATLAPLAPARSCRRVRGGLALGRRFRGGGSLSVRAVRYSRQLCVWSLARSLPPAWRSPSRGAHGAAACARRWRPWRRLGRAAAFAAAWRSAAALPWRRLALSARVALGGSRSLRVVGGAVASSLGAVAVARRSRRRCLRRCAGAPGAGFVVPPHPRRRDARPPLFRGGGSLFRRA